MTARSLGVWCVALIWGLPVLAPLPGAAAEPAGRASASSSADLRAETENAMLEAIRAGDYERAKVILRGARARGLPLGEYHLLKAKVCAAAQDTDGVEQQLRGAIEQDPSLVEAYLRLAAIREERGLWLDATELYRGAVEADPTAVEAYLNLSRVLVSQKRNASGIEVLRKADQAVPSDPRVAMALGQAYEQLGDTKSAREGYQRAAGLATGRLRRRALVKAADLSLADDDVVTAFAYYREAVAEDPRVSVELYGRMARAADKTIWRAFTASWEKLVAYLEATPNALEREDVYLELTKSLTQARAVLAFGDRLAAPSDLKAEHARRVFQNSLVCESLTGAVSYLDTGDEALLRSAKARRLEAVDMRGSQGDGAL